MGPAKQLPYQQEAAILLMDNLDQRLTELSLEEFDQVFSQIQSPLQPCFPF